MEVHGGPSLAPTTGALAIITLADGDNRHNR
jgi:hypothetical protein